MKKPAFKLNGQALNPTQFSNKDRILREIKALPAGEVLTTAELTERADVARNDSALRAPELSAMKTTLRPGLRVWGSARTIQLLNEELNEGKRSR